MNVSYGHCGAHHGTRSSTKSNVAGYDMPDEEHRRVDGARLQDAEEPVLCQFKEKLAAIGSMPPPPIAPPSFAAPLLDQDQLLCSQDWWCM
eukprot:6025557-Amphidinium_carterae.1